MNNKVSIIISCHNKENYVSAAIESALAQSWSNVEIIIVDDNSTDNSRKIINDYKERSVKIFYEKFNNASAARNFGLRRSTGDYIQFLDADDVLHPEKLEKQLHSMLFKIDCVGVCNTKSFFTKIDDEGKEVDTEFIKDEAEPLFFLKRLYENPDIGMVQPNAWLTPRNVIDNAGFWDETLSLDDDGEFFCRVLLAAKNIVHTDKILNFYRRFKTTENLSANRSCKGFASMFQAALLKKKHVELYLQKNKLSEDFSKIYNVLFAMVMVNAYPWCKEISAQAQREIKKTDQVLLPELGGRQIEVIKKLMGWKFAKQLKLIINSFKK